MGVTDHKYGAFKYMLYAPTHLDNARNLPLVVVLHGSGEIGSSLSKLMKREPFLSLRNGKFQPDCYVLMPQLPRKNWGYYAVELINLCTFVQEAVGCDKTRVSLTGHSLGAMGVIEVMLKYPGYFSAGAALSCCRDYSKDLAKLAHMPLWFIHGSKENSYGKYSKAMYRVMDTLNTEARYLSVPGKGHPIQPVWCSEKYGIFEWLTQFHAWELKNPTWEWLLRDMNILDDEGRLTINAQFEIGDEAARAFCLRKSRTWPLDI